MFSLEAHEGTPLYTNNQVNKAIVVSHIHITQVEEREDRGPNLFFRSVGSNGQVVEALARFFLEYPGLYEAVGGMKALLGNLKK